ncbi:MAG: hypothetical protein ACOC1F_06335 [Myxococcota bacterium]
MSFLLDDIGPEARARYVELGRQFGCSDSIAQAELTLDATHEYGERIASHGFIELDAARLRAAQQQLDKEVRAASGRFRKETSRGYVDAVRRGKDARQRARSILYIIAQRLAYSGDPIAAEAARAAGATLQQTESSRGDPIRLAAQLDQLRATLSIPRVDKEAERRGGVETADALKAAAERLRAIAEAQAPDAAPPSTDETANTDLLCGIIVELVRDARRAARSAARESNEPAIAAAFALTKLYGAGSNVDSERSPRLR